ncbi:hypothetical protein A3860_34330 [Niastella vici]|uniref:DUF4136 domain-containing protein n=1 Tax=Niastella vici TaxID=1703345 RepID=A0A1V9FP99_9BACT|nr:DUF4136 domain-containing protein [Niastella vici]OQP60160.1 hypothetical protein A3860_34330 [Niastella vici]
MKYIILIAVSLLIISGCGTYSNLYSDYDKSADFTKYKTFAWLPDKADTTNTPYNNEIIRNNIRNYFGQCMSDRGYSFNAENPDVLMQLVITNTQKERVTTTYPSNYYYRPYYYGSYYYHPYTFGYYYRYYPSYNYSDGSGYSTTRTTAYVNGAITLNFIDRITNKLVWTGTAEGDIYDPGMISRDLHPAVHRIIEKYPVKPINGKNHRI